MMKILILGGDGMLGHRLLKDLGRTHDVRVTLRQDRSVYDEYQLFNGENSFYRIDVRRIERIEEMLSVFRPDVLINAVGVVKQRIDGSEAILNIEINALLPHRLAAICAGIGTRLIQISTDCVFSGRVGGYTEDDEPDPVDLYGRSKLLGEVSGAGCLTLRTSIIGRELSRKKSLLEWFLAQTGRVPGFTNAIYSGFTTIEMSRIMEQLITRFPEASGIYHVSSAPISKYDLLRMIKDRLGLSVEVVPDGKLRCNRSLDSTRFRREFAYSPPTWEKMVDELAAEHRMERRQ